MLQPERANERLVEETGWVAIWVSIRNGGERFTCTRAGRRRRARAEKLLEAMGGRAAWAKVKFVHVEAVHDDVSIRDPFTNKIWNDFTAPRVRFEAKNAEIDRRRVIDADKGARVRDGAQSALTPEQIEDDRKWWEANIYRTLHRLAVNDPELSARAVGEHRVEIFRKDGRRLNWFHLNQRGKPMLFSTWDSEAATTFGPLASSGPIKYPKWGARPDGSWRYEIVRLVAAEKTPLRRVVHDAVDTPSISATTAPPCRFPPCDTSPAGSPTR